MNMEKNRPYSQRLTTIIIIVYAAVILFFGLFVVILGIFGLFDETVRLRLPLVPYLVIFIGLGIIVVGSLIYIIGALSKDVYNILHNNEYLADENENFHRYMAKKMKEIETNQEQIKNGIARISGMIKED